MLKREATLVVNLRVDAWWRHTKRVQRDTTPQPFARGATASMGD